MPEGLPSVDIGQMHFDEGNSYPGEGVANRHAGVGVRGRIEDDEIHFLAPCVLYSIDQFSFMVGLEALCGHAAALGGLYEAPIDVPKRLRAIDFGFTLSEKIEVRPMQKPN